MATVAPFNEMRPSSPTRKNSSAEATAPPRASSDPEEATTRHWRSDSVGKRPAPLSPPKGSSIGAAAPPSAEAKRGADLSLIHI
eukprot:7833978-Alexandrium_andersonii.AAC.1